VQTQAVYDAASKTPVFSTTDDDFYEVGPGGQRAGFQSNNPIAKPPPVPKADVVYDAAVTIKTQPTRQVHAKMDDGDELYAGKVQTQAVYDAASKTPVFSTTDDDYYDSGTLSRQGFEVSNPLSAKTKREDATLEFTSLKKRPPTVKCTYEVAKKCYKSSLEGTRFCKNHICPQCYESGKSSKDDCCDTCKSGSPVKRNLSQEDRETLNQTMQRQQTKVPTEFDLYGKISPMRKQLIGRSTVYRVDPDRVEVALLDTDESQLGCFAFYSSTLEHGDNASDDADIYVAVQSGVESVVNFPIVQGSRDGKPVLWLEAEPKIKFASLEDFTQYYKTQRGALPHRLTSSATITGDEIKVLSKKSMIDMGLRQMSYV